MNSFFSHKNVRLSLYDFLLNNLSPGEMRRVEDHCRSCSRCSAALTELRSALDRIPPAGKTPADELSPDFWRTFASRVDRRIAEPQSPPTLVAEWDNLMVWLIARQRWVYAGSAAVAMVVAVLMMLKPWEQTGKTTAQESRKETPPIAAVSPAVQDSNDIDQVRSRATEYFRKSKALLVGLSNKKVSIRTPVDLSAEQQVSRQLVHEARYLKQQPLDIRSSRLIDDIDRIFIELSNAEARNATPDVEVLRAGIQRANLLFKIRMAEAQFDTGNGFYVTGGR